MNSHTPTHENELPGLGMGGRELDETFEPALMRHFIHIFTMIVYGPKAHFSLAWHMGKAGFEWGAEKTW